MIELPGEETMNGKEINSRWSPGDGASVEHETVKRIPLSECTNTLRIVIEKMGEGVGKKAKTKGQWKMRARMTGHCENEIELGKQVEKKSRTMKRWRNDSEPNLELLQEMIVEKRGKLEIRESKTQIS